MTIEKARIDHYYNEGKACPQMANPDHVLHPLEWLCMSYDPAAEPLSCTLHIKGPAEVLLPGDAAPRQSPYAGHWLSFKVVVGKDYPNLLSNYAIVVSALTSRSTAPFVLLRMQPGPLLERAADNTTFFFHPTSCSL